MKDTAGATSDRVVHIVDDDDAVRRALRRLLTSVGLRSAGYASARSYLESAVLESAVCLLLDIHLPEISGIELLERLKEEAPNLPVICMTGRDEPEIERRVAAAGARACLKKPFDQAQLFKVMAMEADVTIPPDNV